MATMPERLLVGIGGTLLFISGVLYLLNLLLTATVSRVPAPAVPEFAVAAAPPKRPRDTGLAPPIGAPSGVRYRPAQTIWPVPFWRARDQRMRS